MEAAYLSNKYKLSLRENSYLCPCDDGSGKSPPGVEMFNPKAVLLLIFVSDRLSNKLSNEFSLCWSGSWIGDR